MASTVPVSLRFLDIAAASAPVSMLRPFRRSLLASAVALAMLLSAAAVQGGDAVRRTATPLAAATTAPATTAVPAVTAAVGGNGAVYLSREGDRLHFWLVNEIDETVQRKTSIDFDPSLDQIVAVELGDDVTGLFYADNLRNPGDQYRLSLRGPGLRSHIALPLSDKAFLPLAEVTVPDEIVVVAPMQLELQDLIRTQRAIYERVQLLTQAQADQVELFRFEAGQELAGFYDYQIHQAPVGQAFLDRAQSEVQTQHDRFIARVDADLAVLQAAAGEIMHKGATEIARFEGPVIQCINGEVAKLDEQLKRLEATLSSIQSDEPEVSIYDAPIEATEAAVEESEARLMACAEASELEDYNPTVDIDPNAGEYLPILLAAQGLLDYLEPRVDAWQAELESFGIDRTDRMENIALAAAGLAFQDYFDEWISPTYSDESTATESAPAQSGIGDEPAAAVTKAGQGAAPADKAPKALAEEVLCDGETWNVEFIGDFTVVLGTPWNDKVVTGEQANIVTTFAGDDCIETHAGHDVVHAGTGADRIYAGEGNDFAYGGPGDDEIHGGAGRRVEVFGNTGALEIDLGNLLVGQSGDDLLFGGEVAADRGEDGEVDEHGYTDIILGDALLGTSAPGNDYIDGEMGIDFLLGQDGNDDMLNIVPGRIHIAGADIELGSFFSGGNGNDTIAGSDTTSNGTGPLLGDFILGNAGDDAIAANAGTDFILGADGNDSIDAGSGMDFAFGQNGNDSVVGNDGPDVVTGRSGNDIVRGSAGLVDLVFGGEGDDSLYGDEGIDLLSGREGMDNIQGGNGLDLIVGADGGDSINGNAGVDIVLGGPGEDGINGGDDIDLLSGMTDSDLIRGGNATDVIIGNENTGNTEEYLYGEAGIDLVFGLSGPDVIQGGDNLDLLIGNDGDDTISGNGGTDIVFGGFHDDRIDGNDGFDILFGGTNQNAQRISDKDVIDGGSSTDVIFGNADCDTISGGDGSDLIIGGGSKDRVIGGNGIDVMFGGGQQDHIQGGPGVDFLFGGTDHDYLDGGDEQDVIFGGADRDHIYGGPGRDVVFAGLGHDYASGDAGGDLLFGGADHDILEGGDDNDLMFGGLGEDNLNSGNGNDWSFGGAGADKLRAVEGRNWAFGGAGDDRLDGYSPSTPDLGDTLFGGAGDDWLAGNSSNQKDWKFGGLGDDTMANNQTYVATGMFAASWLGNLVCDVQ